MIIEQLYTGCLAEAAYYIESNGEAAIVDPLREPGPYLELARKNGAQIKYIFETHFHADFVSGHIDLAAQTGATIVYGPEAKPEYNVHVATDGEVFKVGDLSLVALHTPGHTLESTCFLLKDGSGKDHAVFTGDTLFVGAVGRPDLAVKSDRPLQPEDLASMLYDSLQSKIMPLADDVLVYPAHGAGSSCGKGIGKETFSTIGVQKASNYALQDMSREAFIKEVTEGLAPPPSYFFEDARINMQGYSPYNEVMDAGQQPLSPAEFEAQMSDALVLDTRIPNDFERGFIPGALNIGLNGQYAIWVGTLVDINQPLLVVAAPGKEEEAIRRLARVGYENVKGYLAGGMEAWSESGRKTQEVRSISAEEFAGEMKMEGVRVLDVRKPGEYATCHLAEADHFPLSKLLQSSHELDPAGNYLVHCAGGYRSMIAASILKMRGVEHVSNVLGGFKSIREQGLPIVKPELA